MKKSTHIANAAWTVFLYNYGPGNCHVKKIEYSYALTGQPASGWKSWDSVVKELADAGIMRSRDYHLRGIGAGSVIPVDSVSREGAELAAFSKECLAKISSMDVALEVEDVLGDIYGRTIECFRAAHKITEFRYGNSAKTVKFRKWSTGRAVFTGGLWNRPR